MSLLKDVSKRIFELADIFEEECTVQDIADEPYELQPTVFKSLNSGGITALHDNMREIRHCKNDFERITLRKQSQGVGKHRKSKAARGCRNK